MTGTTAPGTMDFRAYHRARTGRRITAQNIANTLGCSRTTAVKHLLDGMTAGEAITVARATGLNPLTALVEMGYFTPEEIVDHDSTAGYAGGASTGAIVENTGKGRGTGVEELVLLGRALSALTPETVPLLRHVLDTLPAGPDDGTPAP